MNSNIFTSISNYLYRLESLLIHINLLSNIFIRLWTWLPEEESQALFKF